jgi:hypothetical protein
LDIKSKPAVGISRNLELNHIKKKNSKANLISRAGPSGWGIIHGTVLDIQIRTSSCWHALLLFAKILELPPLDFQPVYIYGHWASGQNQFFASKETWC